MASPEERAQAARFSQTYIDGTAPAMRAIERHVCGCDYGGTSWTTAGQSARLRDLLALRPGVRLLDVGAGSGWPALHMVQSSGCEAVLVDLPLAGLRIAAARAARDGLAPRCGFAVADAAWLPFADGHFDAVSHSDLLCCLLSKREVLAECRRVLRPGGRMVFSVIHIPANLSPAHYRRAVDNSPEFVETNTAYPALLAETGWRLDETIDVTGDYRDCCQRQIEADAVHAAALVDLIGAEDLAARQARCRRRSQRSTTGWFGGTYSSRLEPALSRSRPGPGARRSPRLALNRPSSCGTARRVRSPARRRRPLR